MNLENTIQRAKKFLNSFDVFTAKSKEFVLNTTHQYVLSIQLTDEEYYKRTEKLHKAEKEKNRNSDSYWTRGDRHSTVQKHYSDVLILDKKDIEYLKNKYIQQICENKEAYLNYLKKQEELKLNKYKC